MTVFSLFIRADRFQYPSTRVEIVTQTIKNGNGTVKKFRDINADDNIISIYSVYNEENAETLYRLVKPLVSLPIMHTAY